MSFDSSRKKLGPDAPAKSTTSSGKRSSARGKRALRATIEEYILDHRSQNHSHKTIEWHMLALGNFAAFLEKQGVVYIEDIERVHVLSWLTKLSTEPGVKGKKLAERSVNCYARSMRAFCNWLEAQGYVQMVPSNLEAQRINNQELMNAFRLRAFIARGVTALLGLVGLYFASSEAPVLWHGTLNDGLWAVAITMLISIATAMALWFRGYSLARILIVMEVTAFLGSWGIAQLPYILPPNLTVAQAVGSPTIMREFFFSALVGMLVLMPSLWLLFHVFKFQRAVPPVHEKQAKEAQ